MSEDEINYDREHWLKGYGKGLSDYGARRKPDNREWNSTMDDW